MKQAMKSGGNAQSNEDGCSEEMAKIRKEAAEEERLLFVLLVYSKPDIVCAWPTDDLTCRGMVVGTP
jgi:hypothetical protein